MSEYMIMTDSTVDLPKEYLTEELDLPGKNFLQKSGQGRCRLLLRSIRSRQEKHWNRI